MMMFKVLGVIILISSVLIVSIVLFFHCKVENYDFELSEPLMLTKFINSGKVSEGRKAAEVEPFIGNIKSYSGYLTVFNETFTTNMFFWYFPSEKSESTSPIILWLDGGPGMTPFYELFKGHGPYSLDRHRYISGKKSYWSQDHHVIYLDNLIGAGVSFTDSKNGYCSDQNCIGDQLYEAITQFFKLFPELLKNELYIIGESYACKFSFALAHRIHTNNPNAEVKLNLRGVGISSGYCDPINQLSWNNYAFQLGLIDENDKKIMESMEKRVLSLVEQKSWLQAYLELKRVIFTEAEETFIENHTGFTSYFNILYPEINDIIRELDYLWDFMMEKKNIETLHIGQHYYIAPYEAFYKLRTDYVQSVSSWIQEIANNYRVMFYNGQLDLITSYPMTENFIKKLKWCGSDDYLIAKRKIWKIGNDIAGYIKESSPSDCKGSITEVLIRNSGHFTAVDQPIWVKELIYNFTHNILQVY